MKLDPNYATGDPVHWTIKEIEDELAARFDRRQDTDADRNKWFDYWWTERAIALARIRTIEQQLQYERDYVSRCSARIEQVHK